MKGFFRGGGGGREGFAVCFFKMLVAAAVVVLSPRYQSSRLQPGAEQESPGVIAGETLQGRDHVRM